MSRRRLLRPSPAPSIAGALLRRSNSISSASFPPPPSRSAAERDAAANPSFGFGSGDGAISPSPCEEEEEEEEVIGAPSAPCSYTTDDYFLSPLLDLTSSSDDDDAPSLTFTLFLDYAKQFVHCAHPQSTRRRQHRGEAVESYEQFRKRERRGVVARDYTEVYGSMSGNPGRVEACCHGELDHEAQGASTEQALSPALTSIIDSLKSSDSTAWKAASYLLSLERCKFDKIKPVRDASTHAIQLWKAIPGMDSEPSTRSPTANPYPGLTSEEEQKVLSLPFHVGSGAAVAMATSWDGILNDVGVLHHQQGCTGSSAGTPSAVDHAARPPVPVSIRIMLPSLKAPSFSLALLHDQGTELSPILNVGTISQAKKTYRPFWSIRGGHLQPVRCKKGHSRDNDNAAEWPPASCNKED